MSIEFQEFEISESELWDDFCSESFQATFLHTRRFLSYHGNRFIDQSLFIMEHGKLIGLFPAAQSPHDKTLIVSHPGITYGGVLHQGLLRGSKMIRLLNSLKIYYSNLGFKGILYKSVPTFYHLVPSQDDSYAFFVLGINRVRCDITSIIDLKNRMPMSARRRRCLKKSHSFGIVVEQGIEFIQKFWEVLVENLSASHDVAPVHSLSEIKLLMERFPNNIKCICGVLNGRVLGGTILFIAKNVVHAQYIASSEDGYKYSVLDRVFSYCIDLAASEDIRWFDFGISTENCGKLLNEGLFNFKSEFGAGSMVHEYYEMDLQK